MSPVSCLLQEVGGETGSGVLLLCHCQVHKTAPKCLLLCPEILVSAVQRERTETVLIKAVCTSVPQTGFGFEKFGSYIDSANEESQLSQEHIEELFSGLTKARSSGAQNAKCSKSSAIIIRAALLWTLMVVPVLLPRHIYRGSSETWGCEHMN